MTTTRQVRFYELGGPEVLKLERVPVAEPGRGEIRLRVEAIGLNRAENLYRAGSYIYQPRRYPSPIGYEAAGVVEAVGEGVGEFKPGDRVNTIPAFSMAMRRVRRHCHRSGVCRVKVSRDAFARRGGLDLDAVRHCLQGLIHHANLRKGQTALFTAAWRRRDSDGAPNVGCSNR